MVYVIFSTSKVTLTNLVKIRNKQLIDSGMDKSMLERYQKEMIEEGALKGGINWYRAFPFFISVPNIKVPTTHIWSRKDNSLEEQGALLNENYIDSSYILKIIDDGNHWLPDQNSEEITEIIIENINSSKQ